MEAIGLFSQFAWLVALMELTLSSPLDPKTHWMLFFCASQVITSDGRFNTLQILAAGWKAINRATFTVTVYRNSTARLPKAFSDWRIRNPTPARIRVLKMPYGSKLRRSANI